MLLIITAAVLPLMFLRFEVPLGEANSRHGPYINCFYEYDTLLSWSVVYSSDSSVFLHRWRYAPQKSLDLQSLNAKSAICRAAETEARKAVAFILWAF